MTGGTSDGLSVIVPTLNEAPRIGRLVQRLKAMGAEVVVADGGSADGTVMLAEAAGAVVVRAPRNRGAQLNTGAGVATGAVLWFLHADAVPHARSAVAIERTLRHPRAAGGSFRLRFDSGAGAARVFEAVARMQRRYGVYYGDSGIFVRRRVFTALGGYREWPLFEDYDLARRLERYARRYGGHTVRCQLPLTVSARRFADRPWRTLGLWTALQLLFWLGVSPQRLARLYHRW